MTLSQLRPQDKILPVQPFFRDQFDGSDQELFESMYGLISTTVGFRSASEEFDLELSPQVGLEQMSSSLISLRFLQSLILLSKARRVLEIGAFIGVSTMSFAKVLPENGEMVTIEKYGHFAAIAKNNFKKNGLDHKIRLLEGDAKTVIGELPKDELFDMIFLDGNKENYAEYFQILDPLLRSGGLIVVDDVLFHGDCLNAVPRTEKGKGVKAFLDFVKDCQTYHKAILPICNGTALLIKK